MKKLTSIVGLLALVALTPLLLTPYAPEKIFAKEPVGIQGHIAQNTANPHGISPSYRTKTEPLDTIGGGNEGVKGEGPTIFSALELKQHLPVAGVSTGASTDISTAWKRSALHSITRVKNRYGPLIAREAKNSGLSVDFVTSIIVVESEGNPNALSSVGAKGLMQVMSAAKNDVGLSGDLWDPDTNIRIGTAYLAKLRDTYGYHTPQAIAVAYNIGPTLARHMSTHAIMNHPYAKRVSYVLKNL